MCSEKQEEAKKAFKDQTSRMLSKGHKIRDVIQAKSDPIACPNRYRLIQEICEKRQAERIENGTEELNFND